MVFFGGTDIGDGVLFALLDGDFKGGVTIKIRDVIISVGTFNQIVTSIFGNEFYLVDIVSVFSDDDKLHIIGLIGLQIGIGIVLLTGCETENGIVLALDKSDFLTGIGGLLLVRDGNGEISFVGNIIDKGVAESVFRCSHRRDGLVDHNLFTEFDFIALLDVQGSFCIVIDFVNRRFLDRSDRRSGWCGRRSRRCRRLGR